MRHPYEDLPKEAFWRSAVTDKSAFDIGPLWVPKCVIDRTTRIATFGSCFARHFGTALRSRGFAWTNAEPAPEPLSVPERRRFGYDLFSARIGNVYTARQMRQWLDWASNGTEPQELWTYGGRTYDPFRPTIEPQGFADQAEALASRRNAIEGIRRAIINSDLFVLTLGLTEGWRNRSTGLEYTSAPGVVAEPYDPEKHVLHQHRIHDVLDDLQACLEMLQALQPNIRMLFTVAPGPMIATASGQHVLVATSECKAILRTAAGEMARNPACDYFPSYEILTSHPYRAMFFAPNMRGASSAGVEFVMSTFFNAQGDVSQAPPVSTYINESADPMCDEELLENFASSPSGSILT